MNLSNKPLKNKSAHSGIPNQRMLDYINGKLSGDELHEFEKLMLDSEMINDAVEGLERINERNDPELIAHKLNKQFKRQLHKRPQRLGQKSVKEMNWIFIVILIILLLIIAGYFVVQRLRLIE